MKKNDFLVCSFKGDEAAYVAEITNVSSGSIDCRFVHSEKKYSFSLDGWTVQKSNGGFPIGTPLTKYEVFTPGDTNPALNNIVRVTFSNEKVYLGVLMSEDPLTVVFLHGSRPTYVFEDNVIRISGGAYKVGDTIREIRQFKRSDVLDAGTTPRVTTFEPAVSPQKKISDYDPVAMDTIVSNAREYPSGIPGYRNYKGWKSNADIPHNKKPKKIRAISDIIHITFHESAADTGDGFYDVNDTTSHLSVLKTNEVLQFNDLLEKEYHIGPFNDTSLGIEFVNKGWIQGMPSKESGLKAADREKYREDKGYLWAFCGMGQNIYKMPSADQLEKFGELINRFFTATESDIPKIAKEWLQVISYNDVKDLWEFGSHTPADVDSKRFFIFSNGDVYFTPARIAERSGVYSHACVNSIHKGVPDSHAHPDGSFPTLYHWLRFIKQKTKDEAYTIAQHLIKNHNFIVKTKEKFLHKNGNKEQRYIILVDVADENFSS